MSEKGQNQADTRPLTDVYTEVKTNDTVGAAFLGILALILLIALLRSTARNRALTAQLAQQTK